MIMSCILISDIVMYIVACILYNSVPPFFHVDVVHVGLQWYIYIRRTMVNNCIANQLS